MAVVSKKSRYALHGLAYVAKHSKGEPVPFDEILEYLKDYSSGLTLSPGYIAKIFQSLSRVRILEAIPGPAGGYRLAREPDEIKLLDVIESLEGPLMTECCLLSVGCCERQTSCGVKGLIRDCEMIFHNFLTKHTVASLARRMTFPDPALIRDRSRVRTSRAKRVAARGR